MKYSVLLRMISAFMALLVFLTVPAFAEQALTPQDQAAQALVRLEIMQKDKKGSLRLADKTRRYEFIVFTVLAMSYDTEADSTASEVEFKDLTGKHTAYGQIKTASVHGLITAYKDGTIRPDKAITSGEAIVILLKALGYGEELSDKDNEGVLKLASELGITGNTALKFNDPLTRGNAAIYIRNFMTVDFHKGLE